MVVSRFYRGSKHSEIPANDHFATTCMNRMSVMGVGDYLVMGVADYSTKWRPI